MSSSQPPSQAGKFKPVKQKPKKSTPIAQPTCTSRPTTSAARNHDKPPDSISNRGPGRGSSSRGGRGGRGGRGRGSGRFIQPKGQVFFTASSTSSDNQKKKNIAISDASTATVPDGSETIANNDIIIMPGMSGSTASKTSGATLVASTAEGRKQAAAQARKGEGDEIIVGEIEEGQGVGDHRKSSLSSKVGILDKMGSEKRPSLFDGEDDDEAGNMYSMNDNVADFTYDSDSSTDGEPKRLKQRMNASRNQGKVKHQPLSLLPQQLPVPPTKRPGDRQIDYLYECQIPIESNSASRKGNTNTEIEEVIMDDPPLESPFLNLNKATPEEKSEEQKSWMLFKFPTRLPRIAPQCTISGMSVKDETVKDENAMDIDYNFNNKKQENASSSGLIDPSATSVPEDVTSSSTATTLNTSKSNLQQTGSTSASGSAHTSSYDDTLRDTAAGRYGKIVVYKSGKAYLIVGAPPIRMRLSSGLPCGFLQQAVSIDVDNGFIPLGEVKKSIIVTPDLEMAFPSGR
jgi:hypothetical protein